MLKYHLLSGVAAVRDKCGQGRAGEMIKAPDQLNKQPEFDPWQSQNGKRKLSLPYCPHMTYVKLYLDGNTHMQINK